MESGWEFGFLLSAAKKMGFGALFLFGFFEELTWRECGRGCGNIMVRSFGSSTQLRHVNLGRLESLGFYWSKGAGPSRRWDVSLLLLRGWVPCVCVWFETIFWVSYLHNSRIWEFGGNLPCNAIVTRHGCHLSSGFTWQCGCWMLYAFPRNSFGLARLF